MNFNNTNIKSRTETHISIVLTMNDAILQELENANLAGSEKWIHGSVQGVNIRVYSPLEIEAGKKVFFKLQTHFSQFGHENRRAIFCLNGNLSESAPLEDLEIEEIAEQIAEFFNFQNCDFGMNKVLELLRGSGEDVRLKVPIEELVGEETEIETIERKMEGGRW